MIAELREDFNRRYTPEKYSKLLNRMNLRTRTSLQIRVAETPVFLPAGMVDEMAEQGAAMIRQLVNDKDYLAKARAAIPAGYAVARESAHPNFAQVDFGLVHEGEGPWNGDLSTLQPRLVELQGFPSVYGYQDVLAEGYCDAFQPTGELTQYLGGHTSDSYWETLREVVVGEHCPENVILMEIAPELQKTLPDFHVHEDRLGIATVDITAIRQHGRQLFYERDGIEIQAKRIYNRAIVDELIGKGINPGFDLTADLEVEWAGHPNWYFLLSKFSMPFLRQKTVPPAVFLSDWMAGHGRDRLPKDRQQWILKPLFSFAGKGIVFAPEDSLLEEIPVAKRGEYLLQERMHFEPTVLTPFGPTQAEIRVMYVWPDGGELEALTTLVRLGRGAMMGVDHNRNQEWVGGSAGLISASIPVNFVRGDSSNHEQPRMRSTPAISLIHSKKPSQSPSLEPMRASVRFPLHIPVELHADSGTAPAITEDISATGASFAIRDPFGVGTVITWELRLPADVMGTPDDVHVRCTGRVVWCRGTGEESRMGAVIDEYELKG